MESIMTKKSKSDWSALILEQAQSKLSIAQFCQQQNIGLSSFYNQKRSINNHKPAKRQSNFTRLTPPASNQCREPLITIRHHQTHINLPMDVSSIWLAELVKALV